MKTIAAFFALFLSFAAFAQTPILPPADAEKTASGLITQRLTAGTGGVHPAADSVLRLRYTLSTSEGKLIQKVDAPREVMLPVTKMIPGWREAAAMMVEGETRRAWVTEALGAKGKVPAGGSLVIDTELLEIIPGPKTPDDVAAPPADATVKKNGLAWKVLRPGTGTKHPSMHGNVSVHYSGWTTDGTLFDSSVARGEAANFPLTGVIPGWQQVLQEMVEGERVRVWVPERLAYDGAKGKPKGTLVFEIELLSLD
jgi:FKBP-type peptidyl-prolyl cis-trans isomerase